jgi:hypothetical protein
MFLMFLFNRFASHFAYHEFIPHINNSDTMLLLWLASPNNPRHSIVHIFITKILSRISFACACLLTCLLHSLPVFDRSIWMQINPSLFLLPYPMSLLAARFASLLLLVLFMSIHHHHLVSSIFQWPTVSFLPYHYYAATNWTIIKIN